MSNDLGFYAKLLSRRFPAMAALFLLAACIGAVIALRLPTTYYTRATLLVEAAQIPENMVRSAIQIDASEQLEVIQRRLLTRANLLAVARNNRVFPNQSQMNPDDIVAEMRRRTNIRRNSGRSKATLMVIGFRGEDPRTVAAVVNQYVTIVMATNSDFRTERTEGTLEFFEQEVAALSESLDEQNAKVVAFKRENADALPENLGFRLNRQSLLRERLARTQRDLEALRAQRVSITRIFEATGSLEAIRSNAPLTPEQARMRRLQGDLRVALSVYSETNPKVKLLRSQIDVLTEQMQQARLSGEAEQDAEAPELTPLDISLSELDAREKTLEQEAEETRAELEEVQKSIDRTPANRITLAAMARDQENFQRLYSGAVQRLSQARMGERIELSAKGEQITVLDPASVPTLPSGPNRSGIAGMGLAVGLGLAGGLFALLELLNQTIRRPVDIVRALEITPLATMPRFETVADRRRRRSLQLVTLVIVLLAVPASLWAVDTYYIPLDTLFEKVRDLVI